jgi:hypothetical protein
VFAGLRLDIDSIKTPPESAAALMPAVARQEQ